MRRERTSKQEHEGGDACHNECRLRKLRRERGRERERERERENKKREVKNIIVENGEWK